MGKISYLLGRAKNMNYKNWFTTVDLVHDKTGKPKVSVFFDMLHCAIKYQAGYVDYRLFEMYRMNEKERATVVTRGINNGFIKQFNSDPVGREKLNNKITFNTLFNQYLHRDWINLKEASLEDFKKFVKDKKEIMAKPTDSTCGKGIEKIKVTSKNVKEVYESCLQNHQYLVEEVAVQHPVLSKIYPYSINTVRIVTLKGHVVAAYLRIGNGGHVVDNFNHGGMACAINIDTGIIEFPAISKDSIVYEEHPMTHEKLVGVQIPLWDDVKKMCEDASKLIPEVGYIGWDVCVGPKYPSFIEGNDFPGHDIYQLPVHRHGNIGLLPVFQKALEDEEK